MPEYRLIIDKTIWLNPEFIPRPEDNKIGVEGCLSLKDIFAKVPRWTHIDCKAQNLDGQVVEGALENFVARIVQHECDHLKGVSFINGIDEKDLI